MSVEDRELAALVGIAFERRHAPGYRAAVHAIVDWHDRRHIRWYQRRKRQTSKLVDLLRETA